MRVREVVGKAVRLRHCPATVRRSTTDVAGQQSPNFREDSHGGSPSQETGLHTRDNFSRCSEGNRESTVE